MTTLRSPAPETKKRDAAKKEKSFERKQRNSATRISKCLQVDYQLKKDTYLKEARIGLTFEEDIYTGESEINRHGYVFNRVPPYLALANICPGNLVSYNKRQSQSGLFLFLCCT